VTETPQENRRRGVRASRAKLYHALTEAGLASQAALAERIADIERLDAAPKDTVNRVFRELPVELTTLERVARALGVDAFTLYKTAGEADLGDVTGPWPAAPETAAPPAVAEPAVAAPAAPAPSRFRPAMGIAAGMILVLAAAAAWWLVPVAGDAGDEPVRRAPPLGLGTPTLVVLPLHGDAQGRLASALRSHLGDRFNVAAGTTEVLTGDAAPRAAAATLRTDYTVDGEIVRVGRLAGVRLFVFRNGVRRLFWAESLPAVTVESRVDDVAARAALALSRSTGRATTADPAPYFPSASAQDDFLAGQQYLDQPSSELNVKRAQSRFEAALRKDRRYARAQAGLCEALLEEHWMSNETRLLQDAAGACERAVTLDPEDSVVAAAYAHFLRRTGRNDEAIEHYRRLAAREPQDARALTGMASSLLHAFRQHGDANLLEEAIAVAQQATDADPTAWKPPFTLASLNWFAGDVVAAIEASETALERDRNEYILANLGTFYLCDGDYVRARDAYQEARALSPDSYVGDEFLGQAHYYLGDFQRSATLRRRAIERIGDGEPEIHEMWGNLGDSERHAGNVESAIDAYLKAAEIVERDFLRGNASLADHAARAYYYTILRDLDAELVPERVSATTTAQLEEVYDVLPEPSAHIRAAQAWLRLGQYQRAETSLARATATCRGFGGHPDLRILQARQ
jgi:tetratricopeptide (TPR) repeat protein